MWRLLKAVKSEQKQRAGRQPAPQPHGHRLPEVAEEAAGPGSGQP